MCLSCIFARSKNVVARLEDDLAIGKGFNKGDDEYLGTDFWCLVHFVHIFDQYHGCLFNDVSLIGRFHKQDMKDQLFKWTIYEVTRVAMQLMVCMLNSYKTKELGTYKGHFNAQQGPEFMESLEKELIPRISVVLAKVSQDKTK